MDDPQKGDTVTPCMDVYNAKIQSDGSLDKLKLRIIVRGNLQKKLETSGIQEASTINLKYFLRRLL